MRLAVGSLRARTTFFQAALVGGHLSRLICLLTAANRPPQLSEAISGRASGAVNFETRVDVTYKTADVADRVGPNDDSLSFDF